MSVEGTLQKKVGLARWLERYWMWDPSAGGKLQYWKSDKDCKKKQEAKGLFEGKDLQRVWFPNTSNPLEFHIEFKDKTLILKGKDAKVTSSFVAAISKALTKATEAPRNAEEEDANTAEWDIEQIEQMMHNGQEMTAYFSNNTKKSFKLYCRDLTLHACPVKAGIEKAIISLPLRRISDIYVGKQTPGFDTEVAASVPFDRCFTIISRKYTLDVESQSSQMATHWLTGIKHMLTKSGKAVIVNEQEGGEEGGEGQEGEHAEGGEEQQGEEQQAETAQETAQAAPAAAASASTTEAQKAAAQHAAAEQAAADAVAAATKISPEGGDEDLDLDDDKKTTALIIVDVQNDFCSGGSMSVKDANSIIPIINKLRKRVQFGTVVVTGDWHPENHVSFFANNKDKAGAALFQEIDIGGGRTQMMWPTHCVQKSKGAEFHPELVTEDGDKIVHKGTSAGVDSYSAFTDNDGKTKTDLAEYLHKSGVEDVFVCGLAYDYCVGFTALDAHKEGFNVYVIDDASRGVDDATTRKMKNKLRESEVYIIYADSIPEDALMSENIEVVVDDEVLDAEHDSDHGGHAGAQPKQLGVDDFLSEDFLGGIQAAGGDKAAAVAAASAAADAADDEEEEEEEEAAPEEKSKPEEKKGAAAAAKPAAAAAAKSPAAAKAGDKKAAAPAKAGAKPGAKAAKPAITIRTAPTAKVAAGQAKVVKAPPAKAGVAAKSAAAVAKAGAAKPAAARTGTAAAAAKTPVRAAAAGAAKPAAGAASAVKKPVTPAAAAGARKPGVATPASAARKPGLATGATPARKPGLATPASAVKKPVATPASAVKKPAGTPAAAAAKK